MASLLTMALIGVVLDLEEPGGMSAYDLDDFRVAMSVQYLFWAFGVLQILRFRRRAVRHLKRCTPAPSRLRAGHPWAHPGLDDTGL